MKNACFIGLGILSTIPAIAGCSRSAENKTNIPEHPNILMITCEDISPILGCYGDPAARTPNLDAFAKESILHSNMFTCIGVSSPSRYSLITGRYPSNDGANYMRVNSGDPNYEVVPQDGIKCYTEYLRKAGYYCTNNSKTDYQFKNPLYAWDECGKKAHWKHAPEGQPFFAIFNIFDTHESQVWKTADQPLEVDPKSIQLPPYYPDTEIVRNDLAITYSMVTRMDRIFAGLLQELEDSGKADNTIVIFYSDNGGPLPRQKREIKDSGTRVPFMIRFPDGHLAGTVNNQLNMFIDIPATVLSLAGIRPPEYIQGQAMYGAYAVQDAREWVFGATDRFDEQVEKRGSIRDHRYLYIRNYMPERPIYKPNAYRRQMPMMRQLEEMYAAGQLDEIQSQWFTAPCAEEELYDCLEDPHNINNLAGDPSYAELLEKMREAYSKEWMQTYNQKWEKYTEADFKNEMRPGGVTAQCPAPEISMEKGICTWENASDAFSLVYQLDGANAAGQKGHWSLYTGPFHVDDSVKTIKVTMSRIGYKNNTVTIDR